MTESSSRRACSAVKPRSTRSTGNDSVVVKVRVIGVAQPAPASMATPLSGPSRRTTAARVTVACSEAGSHAPSLQTRTLATPLSSLTSPIRFSPPLPTTSPERLDSADRSIVIVGGRASTTKGRAEAATAHWPS